MNSFYLPEWVKNRVYEHIIDFENDKGPAYRKGYIDALQWVLSLDGGV